MVEGGGSCTRGGCDHGGSGTVTAQAERRWGSAWLLGLRRMKAGRARRSGREEGPVGQGVGRWARRLGPAASPRPEEWAG
jgi:hypothetical protein